MTLSCLDFVLTCVILCPGQTLDSVSVSGFMYPSGFPFWDDHKLTIINIYKRCFASSDGTSFSEPPTTCICRLPKVSLPHFVNHWHLAVKVETLLGSWRIHGKSTTNSPPQMSRLQSQIFPSYVRKEGLATWEIVLDYTGCTNNTSWFACFGPKQQVLQNFCFLVDIPPRQGLKEVKAQICAKFPTTEVICLELELKIAGSACFTKLHPLLWFSGMALDFTAPKWALGRCHWRWWWLKNATIFSVQGGGCDPQRSQEHPELSHAWKHVIDTSLTCHHFSSSFIMSLFTCKK